MIVRLDPASPGTPARQLVTQIAAAIRNEELTPGMRLPTIRSLAADLGLAPGTVARAYADLEREGWVHAQGRRGTIVAELRSDHTEDALARAAETLASIASTVPGGAALAHRSLDVALARIDRTA